MLYWPQSRHLLQTSRFEAMSLLWDFFDVVAFFTCFGRLLPRPYLKFCYYSNWFLLFINFLRADFLIFCVSFLLKKSFILTYGIFSEGGNENGFWTELSNDGETDVELYWTKYGFSCKASFLRQNLGLLLNVTFWDKFTVFSLVLRVVVLAFS